MRKPIIAIDCDDVLAATAEAFLAFSNERWQTNLSIHDMQEDWSKMWALDLKETAKRTEEFLSSGVISSCKKYDEALPVLEFLKRDYSLVVLTSRNNVVNAETRAWLNAEYGDLFDEVYFSGIYDDETLGEEKFQLTKADNLLQIGASYLIDDQIKHCNGANDVGVRAVLFGEYPWNHPAELASGVTRCRRWSEVKGYFEQLRV